MPTAPPKVFLELSKSSYWHGEISSKQWDKLFTISSSLAYMVCLSLAPVAKMWAGWLAPYPRSRRRHLGCDSYSNGLHRRPWKAAQLLCSFENVSSFCCESTSPVLLFSLSRPSCVLASFILSLPSPCSFLTQRTSIALFLASLRGPEHGGEQAGRIEGVSTAASQPWSARLITCARPPHSRPRPRAD